MGAYSELQQAEFAAEANGYTATKHQREVGTGYFDQVSHGHHRRPVLDHRHGMNRLSTSSSAAAELNVNPSSIEPAFLRRQVYHLPQMLR
jgi:hypothetical protein